MTRHKNLPAVRSRRDIYPRFIGFRQDLQSGQSLEIFLADLRMAGLGHHENFVEAAEKLDVGFVDAVGEYPEHLVGQGILRHTEVII
ncbi:hypothetical protein D3C75_1275110 [compost metagenome]